MANTTVTKVSELLLTNVTAGAKAGEQKVSETSGFSEVMKGAKDTTAKVEPVKSEDGAKSQRTIVETPKSKEIKAEEPVKKDPAANRIFPITFFFICPPMRFAYAYSVLFFAESAFRRTLPCVFSTVPYLDTDSRFPDGIREY